MNTREVLLLGALAIALILPVNLCIRSVSTLIAERMHGPKGTRQIALTFDDSRVLAAVASLGFQPVYGASDRLDSMGQRKYPRFLFNRIATKTDAEMDGSIILVHVDEPATAAVVPLWIQALPARGFQIVRISRLLKPLP